MINKLKESREKAGYTIEEVADKLKIRKQYLIDLEEGNLNNIPGQVYVEGYTKMYCKFLGITPPLTNETSSRPSDSINKQPKPAKNYQKYVVFISIFMLILVVSLYNLLEYEDTSCSSSLIDNEVINIEEESNGNN